MTVGPPFSAHPDLAGYLDALRDRARIPVYTGAGDRSAALTESAELAELAELAVLTDSAELGAAARLSNEAAPPGPAGGVLVLAPPGSAAAPVAAALAERVGGTFTGWAPGEPATLADALADARTDAPASGAEGGVDHVVLAALADELSLDLVLGTLDATAALRRAGHGDAALGVVLGRDLGELSRLIAKGLGCGLRTPPDHPQLCVAPWGDGQRADTPGVHWVTGADARAEVVAPLLTGRRHGLVSFAVAGREHGLVLSDTVVCGAVGDRAAAGQAPAPAGAPSCAFTGQCFRPGVDAAGVVPAREVRADVVLANSCMSWRPGHGLVAADYQLTNAFAHGTAAAFIGAVHRMVPDVRLNRLAHRAAAAGADVGRLGILLNRQAAGREVPHYLVLGLPWVVPVPGAGPVRLEDLAALVDRTAPAGDGGTRARLRQAGRAIRALRELPLAGLLPADGLPELDARVTTAVAVLKGDPSVVATDADGDPVERLLERVAEAEYGVALDLYDFGQVSESSLNEVWEDFLETTAVPGTVRCRYCGGPTATVTGRHPAHPRLVREVRACHSCGPVLDLPAGSPIHDITVDCPPVWPRPGTVTVEVTVTAADPSAEEPAEGLAEGPAGGFPAAVLVQVARGAVHGLAGPEPQRLRLVPGSPLRVRAEVEVAEHAFAHPEHAVRAVVVAGGQVHSASRPVAVRPAQG
ncbi:hypothetical protein [Kitasatospora sp. NPDC086791]|uniref:hypothetical protein n=1 Tax=Kitasatospora sp. NPDC086791 TaxID=3155178 RepID=UPI003434CB40